MFLRKFIILKKQSSKDVKGHVRLEVRGTKGKLSMSLEGVQFKEDTVYKLYCVSSEQSGFKETTLGSVDVNKSGRGKLDLTFNPNSVNESKIDISDFNILLLKQEDAINNDSEVILGGYIHSDDQSISKVISNKRSQRPKRQSDEQADKIEVKEIKEAEEIEEIVQTEEEVNQTEEIEEIQDKEESKNEIEEEQKEQKSEQLEESTSQIDYEIENLESYIENCKKYTSEEHIESKDSSKNYSEQIASYTLDILKFFKQTKPFKVELENYTWWQIDYDKINSQRGFLPYYSYISDSPYSRSYTSRYTTCQNQIKRYKRYLFGVVESDNKITHYIYGIPGKYEKSEQPYGGRTGFVTWLEDKSKTGSGYWLSYIDAYTGNVVRPL